MFRRTPHDKNQSFDGISETHYSSAIDADTSLSSFKYFSFIILMSNFFRVFADCVKFLKDKTPKIIRYEHCNSQYWFFCNDIPSLRGLLANTTYVHLTTKTRNHYFEHFQVSVVSARVQMVFDNKLFIDWLASRTRLQYLVSIRNLSIFFDVT